jgi:hypothetical protein
MAAQPNAQRRIDFVASAAVAPPERPDSLVVVLDGAWTPGPDERPGLVPVRRLFADVIERFDLFDDALALVDAWAASTAVADRLVINGVTYWFRLRETMWRWLEERLLWRRALALLDPGGKVAEVTMPADEAALADIARLLWPRVVVGDPSKTEAPVIAAVGASAVAARRNARRIPGAGRLRRFLGIGRSAAATSPEKEERARRESVLAERVARVISGRAPRALVLTNPATYQRIAADGGRRQDPIFGAIVPRLLEAGIEPILFGTYVDHRRDPDWALVVGEERLLPQAMLRTRWSTGDDDAGADLATASIGPALEPVRRSRLDVDGMDLAHTFVDALEDAADSIIRTDALALPRIERLIDELAPGAILLAQEGIRTPWLVAGRRAGVPVFAVQHGVLYAGHPGYPNRRHPAIVLPSRTFVYGDFERDVLVGRDVYAPNEVEVSGSPRLDLDVVPLDAARAADERRDVRRELGVANGDRLLVVSTVNLRSVQRSHFAATLDRVLGAALPGIHIVFKQHPGEFDAGPYRALLEGLAHAGGYSAPPITIVKDVDLYRLLRAADAHLGVLSTVLTEAVVAGTPNLIATVDRHADLLGYVSAGVARPVRSPADLIAELVDPRPPEPAARRAFLAHHFRPGDASGRIVSDIAATVRSTAVLA